MTSEVIAEVPARPAVFLDRDGVLNEAVVRDRKPYPPSSLTQLRLLPGVVDACAKLRRLGYELVVITNQPDIARGTQTLAEVERMHAYLLDTLPLSEIVMCPHDDAEDCACRKPRPGMLFDAADRLNLELARSFCIGDRWRDIEAARRAGVRAIHIDWHYDERKAEGADAVVSSLDQAVPVIMSMQAKETWR